MKHSIVPSKSKNIINYLHFNICQALFTTVVGDTTTGLINLRSRTKVDLNPNDPPFIY